MFAVVLETLTAFHAAAVGETGLATALAALTALASGPVAAILVLVALPADVLAGEGVLWESEPGGENDGEGAEDPAAR